MIKVPDSLDYVIYADKNPNRSSGGRTVLHTLRDLLVEKGYNAIIETDADEAHKKAGDDFIAIYPDRVSGNPLETGRVVRYMLHKKDYFDKTPRQYGSNELMFRHSIMLPYDCPVLHIPVTEKDFYYSESHPRTQTVFYEGKYKIKPYDVSLIEKVEGLEWIELKRDEPIARWQLATLLGHSKYFFCLDSFTILKLEAVLCGCICVLFENPDFSKRDYDNSEYGLSGCIWIKEGDSVTEQLRVQTKAAEMSMEAARQKLFYAYGAMGPSLENFILRSQNL